jgi:hypothetical protein
MKATRLLTALCVCSMSVTTARGTGLLLQNIDVVDPNLTATIIMSKSAGDCTAPGIDVWQVPHGLEACAILGTDIGEAAVADGTLVRWYRDSQQSDPTCVTSPPTQRSAVRLLATGPDKRTRELLRVDVYRGFDCSSNQPARYLSGSANISFDVTNGILLIGMDRQIVDPATGLSLEEDRGIVAVSGLPKLFDTLLTFVPGGQSLTAVIPAHPDGFRSADSLQIWTGDVRTLPDWSQAQPLTCNAATSPTPGQVVTIADTLPDPPVGHGRYYLTASVSGPDRRFGRQYVQGTYSARDPNTLPVCQ